MHATCMLDSPLARRGPQGLAHWALVLQDNTMRGPIGQAFQRALKSNDVASRIYPWLPDTQKLQFRQSWALSKDWGFLKETRTVTNSQSRSTTDRGEMLPMVGIAAKLGSCDNPECLRMAQAYCDRARTVGGKFIGWSSWLNAEVFLYIRRLMDAQSKTQWLEAVESYSTENLWSARMHEERAKANYAVVKGLPRGTVTLETIEATPEGLQGWASMTVASPPVVGRPPKAIAGTKPEPKAKARGVKRGASQDLDDDETDADAAETAPSEQSPRDVGKPKPKRKSQAAPPLLLAEKQSKAMLAVIAQCEFDSSNISAAVAADNAAWTWAADFLQQATALQNQLSEKGSALGSFLPEYRNACLDAARMRALKKKLGDDMLPKLNVMVETMNPIVVQWQEVLATIDRMNGGKNEKGSPATTQKAKAKAKGKAKGKAKAAGAGDQV